MMADSYGKRVQLKKTGIRHLVVSDWDAIIVPVSGGKDSQAVLSLALETPGVRERLVCAHQFTGYDHSLTLRHLDYMAEHYQVENIVTRHEKFTDVFDLIEKERYFPSSVARSCTSRLKILPFGKWLLNEGYATKRTLVLLGMRAGESRARSAKYADIDVTDLFSICDVSKGYSKKLKGIMVNLPIVNLSTGQIFDYLAATGAKVNPLYRKGHKRVGCYPCLLAGDKEWALAARDPEGRAHMERLVGIEDRFLADTTNKRKLIRIHPTRDVRGLLGAKPVDPFGFSDDDEAGGCAICMT